MLRNSRVGLIATQLKTKLHLDPYLSTLLIVVIATRLFIFNELGTIYYIDSHYYLAQAIDFSQGTAVLGFSRGFPFIFYLGVFVKLSFLLSIDPTVAAKLAMFVLNLFFFPIVFLALKRLVNERYAFLSTIFLTFDAAFLEYSLVPYLELFALLMGWLASLMIFLYFHKPKTQFLLLGFVFCVISLLTRFEMSLVFSVPILLTVTVRSFILKQNRRVIALIWISLAAFLIVYGTTLVQYYYSTTRFDPISRLIMGLNFNVIIIAAISIFWITDNAVLNLAYMLICLSGFLWFIKSLIVSSRNRIRANDQRSFGTYSIALFIAMTLASLLIALVFYAYSYTIINGTVIVSPQLISTRFLMLIRSFSVPLFAYGSYRASAILRNTLFVSKLNRKPEMAKRIALAMIIAMLILYLPVTWSNGITRAGQDSAYMDAYRETALWLSSAENNNGIVFLPVDSVFYVYSPGLKNNSLSYGVIWKMAGVVYKADTTPQELALVRETLINYIKQHHNVKFLVKDWMDPITTIFDLNVNDELYNLTRIAHVEQVKSGSYRPSVITYEVINYTFNPSSALPTSNCAQSLSQF